MDLIVMIILSIAISLITSIINALGLPFLAFVLFVSVLSFALSTIRASIAKNN